MKRVIYLSLQVGCQENHFRKRSLKKLKFQWKLKSIANINVDVVCTSFYEWAPILKTILESGLAPPFCLPRQLQDISSAPNGRHALPPEIKRREQISLESSIWYKEATLQFDCWLLKKKERKKNTPGNDVYIAVENAYSCAYYFYGVLRTEKLTRHWKSNFMLKTTQVNRSQEKHTYMYKCVSTVSDL